MEEGYASTPNGEPTATFGPASALATGAGRYGGLLLLTTTALALASCGGTSLLHTGTGGSTTTAARRASKPVVCAPAAEAALARSLSGSVASGTITAKAGTSSEATPQCTFRAGKVKVVAILDSAPQPYFRLERTVEEATQQFSSAPLPMPVHLGGLGLDADWFPQPKQIETTDGRRLITVTVAWHGVPTKRQVALAKVIARTYLGPLDRKAADPPGS